MHNLLTCVNYNGRHCFYHLPRSSNMSCNNLLHIFARPPPPGFFLPAYLNASAMALVHLR